MIIFGCPTNRYRSFATGYGKQDYKRGLFVVSGLVGERLVGGARRGAQGARRGAQGAGQKTTGVGGTPTGGVGLNLYPPSSAAPRFPLVLVAYPCTVRFL